MTEILLSISGLPIYKLGQFLELEDCCYDIENHD
jgi:hypothetical protein